MLEFKEVKVVDCQDFDNLVESTYGKPYRLQQQEDCRDKGAFQFEFEAPVARPWDFKRSSIPEDLHSGIEGVSFLAWLERDPNKLLPPSFEGDCTSHSTELWWYRNFYPDLSMLVMNLYSRGLIPAGKYIMKIDW